MRHKIGVLLYNPFSLKNFGWRNDRKIRLTWNFLSFYFLLPFCLSIFGHDERAMALYPTDRKRKRIARKIPLGLGATHLGVHLM